MGLMCSTSRCVQTVKQCTIYLVQNLLKLPSLPLSIQRVLFCKTTVHFLSLVLNCTEILKIQTNPLWVNREKYFYFSLYSMNFRILHWVDYFVSDIMTEIIRFPNSKNLLSPELQGWASQRSTSNIFKQLLVFVIIALSTTDSVSMVLVTNFSPCPKRRIWLNFSTGIVIIWMRMLTFQGRHCPCPTLTGMARVETPVFFCLFKKFLWPFFPVFCPYVTGFWPLCHLFLKYS